MLDLVEGRSQCPAPTTLSTNSSSDIQNWVERDQLALGWILSTVDDFITTQLIGCETSHDAWTTLERNFSQQTQARAMQLRTEFNNLKKGSLTMAAYLNKAKLLVDQLAAIERPLSPDDILSRVLHGLGPEYSGFRTALNLSGVSHTLDSLHAPLLNQEASLLLDEPVTAELSAASPMAHFASQSSRPNLHHRPEWPNRQGSLPPPPSGSPVSSRFNRGGGRGTRNLRCQLCNKHGHSAPTCYQRFNQNFQNRPMSRSQPPQAHTVQAYMHPNPASSPQPGLLPTPTPLVGPHA